MQSTLGSRRSFIAAAGVFIAATGPLSPRCRAFAITVKIQPVSTFVRRELATKEIAASSK